MCNKLILNKQKLLTLLTESWHKLLLKKRDVRDKTNDLLVTSLFYNNGVTNNI